MSTSVSSNAAIHRGRGVGRGQVERARRRLALERVGVGGREHPAPAAAQDPRARQVDERRVGVLAEAQHVEAVVTRDERVGGTVGGIDDRVRRADLVDRAVDPREAAPREHEEDLLLGEVDVDRPDARAGVDLDALHADRARSRGAAEVAPP